MSNKQILMRARTVVTLLGLIAAGAGQAQTAESSSQASGAGNSQAVLNFRTCTKPVYPHEELRAGHQGTVKLGFLVKPDGTVGDTKVVASTGFPALDEAARSALARCQFSPPMRDGQPVEAWTDVQYIWSTK